MSKCFWILIFCVTNSIINTSAAVIPSSFLESAEVLITQPNLTDVSSTEDIFSPKGEIITGDDEEPVTNLADSTESTENMSVSFGDPNELKPDCEDVVGEANNIVEIEATKLIDDANGTKIEEIVVTVIDPAKDLTNVTNDGNTVRNTDINSTDFTSTMKNESSLIEKTKETQQSKNEEILSKIEMAIAKSNEANNCKTPKVQAPSMVPIFKPKRPCNTKLDNSIQNRVPCSQNSIAEGTNLINNGKSTEAKNSQSSLNQEDKNPSFKITGAVLRPLTSFGASNCGTKFRETITRTKSSMNLNKQPVINLGALAPSSNQNQLCSNVKVANYECSNKNGMVIFFKPETVSLEEVYGEFLKKVTMTVLVPMYVTKLAVN